MESATPPRPASKSSTTTSNVITTPSAPSQPSLDHPSPRSGISSATSIQFLDSPSSWKPSKRLPLSTKPSFRPHCSKPAIRWLAAAVLLAMAAFSLHHLSARDVMGGLPEEWRSDVRIQDVLRPNLIEKVRKPKDDPQEWIKKQSALSDDQKAPQRRPKAALISLVRNEELDGILQSMKQLEYHWNDRYRYPWIFFSEKPFSDEFKAATSNLTNAPTQYELLPREHWSKPSWINEIRYMNSLDYLGTIGVGKGHLLSYRAMCRWNSGFFYKHPALKDYDYYWRVEPDVHFFCDIPYDPFLFLSTFNMIYGFNMAILEDARSFPSLFRTTLDFISSHPDLIHPNADLSWLLDPSTGEYNNCQFFSNFEIGNLKFFRSEANTAYFEYLDNAGGFFYERFGDAPIHTLSVSMFAPKEKVWFFRDIGYQHDIARQCPPRSAGRCSCEPTKLDENFYKLVPMESPQRKPPDTCIRGWLGGEWVEKKEGWKQEVERAFGGDGYGGYVKEV